MPSVHKQQSFYQTLALTGIDYYFAGNPSILRSHCPVVCAACLVILDEDPHRLTPSQQKILAGMLKVLDLKPDDFCVAWMASADQIAEAILKYAPYSVLFLSAVIPAQAGIQASTHSETGIIIRHTYSPQVLEADPKHKRAAFDTLLHLKEQLSRLCVSQ